MFKVSYRVIYGDTDCGGVVYYGTYFRLFEIGRTELLREAGLTYREIEEKDEIILPVVEAHARYRAPARYDDKLLIETQLMELKPFKVRFDYRLYRDDKLIAEGYTIHAPINKSGKLTRLPARILRQLEHLVISAKTGKNSE